MTKAEKKKLTKKLVMDQLAKIGYGDGYDDFVYALAGDEPRFKEDVLAEADELLMEQMNRVAKLMGYEQAWFY